MDHSWEAEADVAAVLGAEEIEVLRGELETELLLGRCDEVLGEGRLEVGEIGGDVPDCFGDCDHDGSSMGLVVAAARLAWLLREFTQERLASGLWEEWWFARAAH